MIDFFFVVKLSHRTVDIEQLKIDRGIFIAHLLLLFFYCHGTATKKIGKN
jgi:hypothetical protein